MDSLREAANLLERLPSHIRVTSFVILGPSMNTLRAFVNAYEYHANKETDPYGPVFEARQEESFRIDMNTVGCWASFKMTTEFLPSKPTACSGAQYENFD